MYVERFGEQYLTVFNDSGQERTVTITMEGGSPKSGRELVHRRAFNWRGRKTTMTLGGEDVALIQID